MKNRFLTLLTVTMLAGSIFVGCGGNDTGANTGADSGTNTTTEANSDDNTVKIDPNIEYTETPIAFVVVNDADIDKSMVDGTEVPDITPDITENATEYKVTFKAEVNLYSKDKSMIGYLKPNTEVAFVEILDGWAIVGSIDYTETYFLRMSEVESLVEIIGETSAVVDVESEVEAETETTISDKAKEHFDKIRAGIAEDNKTREEAQKQYPNIEFPLLIEVDSPEGLELFGSFNDRLNSDEDVNNMIVALRSMDYKKFYIEYLGETEEYVNYNFYAIK